MKSLSAVSCLLALTVVVACGDGDEATESSTVLPDATVSAETSVDSAVEGSSAEATGGDGASSTDGADATSNGDGGALDDGADGTAIVADVRADGPGGDGSLILGGDGANADASFQFKNPVATDLLSYNDVHTDCTTVAGATAGTFVMTCQEKAGSSGPCRTITITFAVTNPTTGPTTGQVLTTVAKASPASGEAVVAYQESIDCTAASTNGWTVVPGGGTLTIDNRGDTGMFFTLANVPMGPATSPGVVNQNATGTFTLGGTGFTTLPFD
jgi:hypothetical protein